MELYYQTIAWFQKSFKIQNIPVNPVKFQRSLEAVAQTCSAKKMFLEISQNSQENICARASIFIKLQAWGLQL